MARNISTKVREAAIVAYVNWCEHQHAKVGVTVREVWEALRDPKLLGDYVTLQAYGEAMKRLAERGVLAVLDDESQGARKYCSAGGERLSLVDIVDGVRRQSLTPSDIARYLNAVRYFESRRNDVLRQAVLGLMEEDPVELIISMFRDKVDELNDTIRQYRAKGKPNHLRGDVEELHRKLRLLVHSNYGLSARFIDLGNIRDLLQGSIAITPDWDRIRGHIRERVFGDSVLFEVDVGDSSAHNRPFVVGGSDGSSHSRGVSVGASTSVADDGAELVLTFNNALAALKLPEVLATRFDFPYHSVPLNRVAFESTENFGMVLGRPWFLDLSDTAFEHLKQTALEAVHYRVDDRVMRGVAKAMGDIGHAARGVGSSLPKPVVHFRDGPVAIQDRELRNYFQDSVLGDLCREVVALSLSILQGVSQSDRTTFAGVVKSTQMQAFAALVNWYISTGSRHTDIRGKRSGCSIDPDWDIALAGLANDHQVMTHLMAAAETELDGADRMQNGRYLCSFAILRPFPQLASELRYLKVSDCSWVDYFQSEVDRSRRRWSESGGDPHYLDGSDVQSDSFVTMCRLADYVSFYVGHTGGDPPPLIPRYEFLDSLRRLSTEEMHDRVMAKMKLLVQSLHDWKWAQDRDHDYFSDRAAVRILPWIVYDAHEKSKVWGGRLDAHFRAAIFEKIAEGNLVHGSGPRNLVFRPISASEYIEDVIRGLGTDALAEQLPLL